MRKAAVSACLVFATLFALPTAAGAQGGDPPGPKKFEKVTLNDRPGEPVSLAVLPDRRVLHTARGGQVRLFDPRRQVWADHFRWSEAGDEIVGLTPTGRATVAVLQLNRPVRMIARRAWVSVGWHPPPA